MNSNRSPGVFYLPMPVALLPGSPGARAAACRWSPTSGGCRHPADPAVKGVTPLRKTEEHPT